MKIKPFIPGAVEVWARSVVEALVRLTLRDNVAGVSVAAQWNSAQGLTLSAQRMPRAILLLRAELQSAPVGYVSGGAVEWSQLPDGTIRITALPALTTDVAWNVDLFLLED